MKRIPELRDLSEDHHHGLVLARRAKRAAAGQEPVDAVWSEVERAFERELNVHFEIEEAYLADPMVSAGEAERVEKLFKEHRHIRSLVAPGAPRTAETLEQFGQALEKHIRFEERDFFEAAQKKLPADVLTAVAKACKERGV